MTYGRIPQRLEGLRAQLRDQVLDGFVLFVTEGSNWEGAYYISGFRGSSATLLIT
ncbi:MAG TPA: aminopeptidase P family N-terminal domain-containing protein, partial [Thermosynergistes sp.]|nr:aminopeptidase P family N-terminal domain-containing protein [Thermosynergistes sp.]